VRDGAGGMGTIIYQADLYTAANARDQLVEDELDMRATAGNYLTVEFLAGTASDYQSISAQGDYVPPGTPYGATLSGE
jgi:hypothetical protein